MSRWMLRQCSQDLSMAAKDLNVDPVVAHLLYVRGFKTVEEMSGFLNAEQTQLPPASLFLGMEKGIALISRVIKEQRRIAIFGDYDADGIMSTVILYRSIKKLGGDVIYYIPQRETEGYGLNNDALQLLKDQGVEVLLACDNGISAIEQVNFARSLGIQVVIIDHHDVPFDPACPETELLPAADAIINPKQKNCPYPFKLYCAGGLSYRFAEELYLDREEAWAELKTDFLIFAAIATVCDLVDLTSDNRMLLKRALQIFNNCDNLGINALLTACHLNKQEITTYHIGYIIGPCINASGRLEIANIAAELFITEDEEQALLLAQKLIELNNSRKELTAQGVDTALAEISFNDSYLQDRVMVIYCPDIHPSISGIVAGKIKEKYYQPAVVLAGDKDIVKGSCRSIEGYNIFEGLLQCRDFLDSFGGHPMAAGLSIKKEYIDKLRETMNVNCALTDEEMSPLIYIDKQLAIHDSSLSLAEAINSLQPFGKANPKPIFADKNILISRVNLFGKNKQVLNLVCYKHNNANKINIISFSDKERFQEVVITAYGEEAWTALLQGRGLISADIVYNLNVNDYNGEVSLQLRLIDFRLR